MVCCLGSLVQWCCGEGGALQTNVTGLCGEHSQCSGHSGFAPTHGCVLPLSTLLRLQAALQGVGPELGAVPVFGYSTKARTQLGLCFVPSPALSSSGRQELDKRTLPRCGAPSPLHGPSLSFHVRLLGAPCACSGELVSSHHPPTRCQPSRISGSLWLETGNMFAVW